MLCIYMCIYGIWYVYIFRFVGVCFDVLARSLTRLFEWRSRCRCVVTGCRGQAFIGAWLFLIFLTVLPLLVTLWGGTRVFVSAWCFAWRNWQPAYFCLWSRDGVRVLYLLGATTAHSTACATLPAVVAVCGVGVACGGSVTVTVVVCAIYQLKLYINII